MRGSVGAEKHLASVEADMPRGKWINSDRAATRFKEWATTRIETRSHLEPETFAGYESLLRVWVLPMFGNLRPRPD